MSSGHHPELDDGPRYEHLLDAALADPRVKQVLARGIKVDATYDLPYVAGISNDMRTFYRDRHLPSSFQIRDIRVNQTPYLIRHERVEGALMKILGMKYLVKNGVGAHNLATCAELRKLAEALKRRGIKDVRPYLEAYQDAFKPWIKADAHEKLKRVPRQLFLGPYQDEHDTKLLERMKEAMK